MCVSNDRQRRVILVTILLRLLWPVAPDAFADTCCPWSQVGNLAQSRVGSSAALLSTGRVLVAGGFGVQNDPKKFVEMYDPATGRWAPAKPMNFFRAYHTATLLHNGKVLVAGGFNGSVDAIASAELYDPVAGTWTTTGSLNIARTRHSATLLADGRVLVAGGDDGSADLASCEVYDPATGQWTPTGSLNVTRSLHSATRLSNGSVLAVGGRPTKSAELFDPQTGNWTFTGYTNQVHFFGHTATLLRSGYVLLAGGTNVNGSGDYVSTVELYDPGTATWSTTASLPEPRGSHSATLLPDGGVLIAGGITSGTDEDDRRTYVYRLLFPPLGSWTPAKSIAVRRHDHTATLLTEGRVLIAAGKDNPSAPVITEVYNPAVTDHDPAGPMTIGRRFHSATILPDGRVLMAGGQDPAFVTLSSAELFDPATGLFQPTGAMAVPRRSHTATLLPTGQVLVSGGTSGGRGGTIESSAELYDPALGQWLMTGSMNAARHSHTATLLDGGQVLVLGGTGASGALAQAESYDPKSGSWTPNGPLLSPRSGHTATMLGNGRVVAVGGNTGFATAEVYNPETGISVATGPLPANHRVGHTASLLPNGLVLVAGGFDGSLPRSEASLFQPRTATWNATGTMVDARTEHTATLLPNGRVLMIGGSEADQFSLVFTEEYDPAAGKFALTLLVQARQQHTATLLLNGKVLLAGGNDTYYLGSNTIGIIDSADVYDEGRRPPTSLLPTLGPLSPTSPGATLAIVGTGFAPPHEGSSGRSQSASPANYPLLVLQREDNEGVAYAPVTVWGASFVFDLMSTTVPATVKRGWYHARIVVNGVPSASRLILIQ